MPNKTEHYQLNQYQPGDDFLRTDFNEDNAKIDVAIAGKCEMVYGTYTGDGTATREIHLGFRPKVVLTCNQEGRMIQNYTAHGGMALDGFPCQSRMGTSNMYPIVTISANGFIVGSKKINISYYISSNDLNNLYYYLALK